MQEFHPGEWCFDPYAKRCERCDAIIGRYAVMSDEHGFRHVLFWPHAEWDGVSGSKRRCSLRCPVLESLQVDLLRVDGDHVAGAPCLDR